MKLSTNISHIYRVATTNINMNFEEEKISMNAILCESITMSCKHIEMIQAQKLENRYEQMRLLQIGAAKVI